MVHVHLWALSVEAADPNWAGIVPNGERAELLEAAAARTIADVLAIVVDAVGLERTLLCKRDERNLRVSTRVGALVVPFSMRFDVM